MILAEDQNLISKNDKNFIWIRHFYDSLRLVQFITSNGNDIIDIGSGAGLPGIPVSLLFSSKNKVFLCENRPKRVSFLNKCIVNLDLKNTEVIPIKAEKIENKKFDIVLARAVSQLKHLLSISSLSKKGVTRILQRAAEFERKESLFVPNGFVSQCLLRVITNQNCTITRGNSREREDTGVSSRSNITHLKSCFRSLCIF